MIKDKIHHIEDQYHKEVNGLVNKALQLIRSKYGLWSLGVISFIDSAVAFPGPIDPLLAAYIVADRSKVWAGFLVATLASVIGGVFLYAVAAVFTEQLFSHFSPESANTFNEIVAKFNQGTFSLAFLGALTPIPYGIVVIAVGALKGNIFMFIAGSLLGRGFRFGVVSYLTYKFGKQALDLTKKHLKLFSIFVLVIFSLYVLFKIHS